MSLYSKYSSPWGPTNRLWLYFLLALILLPYMRAHICTQHMSQRLTHGRPTYEGKVVTELSYSFRVL